MEHRARAVRSRLIVGSVFLLATGSIASAVATSPVPSKVPDGADAAPVAGSYALRVCRGGRCRTDRDRDVLRVLFIDFDPASQRKPGGQEAPDPAGAPQRASSELHGTGCFALMRQVGSAPTYAGLGVAGHMHWSYDTASGHLEFDPGRSPDAWYEVQATFRRGTINGVGRSHGGNEDADEWPADTVVGHRIGTSDSVPCVRTYRRWEDSVASPPTDSSRRRPH